MSLPHRDQMIIDAVAQIFVPMIDALNRRLEEVEKGGVRYCGQYVRAQEYKRGSMVTHDNALWCAIVDVKPNEQPGKASAWQLAAKAPRQPTQERKLHAND